MQMFSFQEDDSDSLGVWGIFFLTITTIT